MKKSFYLFTVLFFALAMMFTSPAMAHDRDPKPTPTPTPTPAPTALPINGGIVFLMVAGLAVGVATVSKARLPKETAFKG